MEAVTGEVTENRMGRRRGNEGEYFEGDKVKVVKKTKWMELYEKSPFFKYKKLFQT